MKSTKKHKPEPEIKYPCLMESTINGEVVLFVSNREGTQITKSKDGHIGRYSTYWNDSSNSEFWRPFQGQVILEND